MNLVPHTRGSRVAAVVLALAALALPACAAGGPVVTLDEFTIKAPDLEPGRTEVDVRNAGAVPHTLIVLDTRLDADDLPVKKGQVDLEADGIRVVRAIDDPIAAGDTVRAALTLRPGRYVLICNVAGHYESKMFSTLRVG